MPKLIDAFLFSYELDLLELRLAELHDIVDDFIIVDSLESHKGIKREPLFTGKTLLPNVHYHVLPQLEPSYTDGPSIRQREIYQWEFLLTAARRIGSDNDVLIVSCVDEIPRASALREILPLAEPQLFELDMFYYTVNNYMEKYEGPRIARIRDFNRLGGVLGVHRAITKYTAPMIPNGGWHLTNFGGPKRVRWKLENCSHSHERIYLEYIKKTDAEMVHDFFTGWPMDGRDYPYQEHRRADDPRLPSAFLLNPERFPHFTEEHYATCVS